MATKPGETHLRRKCTAFKDPDRQKLVKFDKDLCNVKILGYNFLVATSKVADPQEGVVETAFSDFRQRIDQQYSYRRLWENLRHCRGHR